MSPADGSKRVGFLFTRYPVLSERFLVREVQELRDLGLSLKIFPTWSGEDRIEGAPAPEERFQPIELLQVLWRIPWWALKRPRAMVTLAQCLIGCAPPNWLNLWENLLGMGYGLIRANKLTKSCDHLHAVWASAPATAAWTVHLLTGIPFSMAGHAYDLFENGGDWLLSHKIRDAAFIRTSTRNGYERWIQLGADPAKLHLIRRGLSNLPDQLPESRKCQRDQPFQLLAVGRMVEKMGFEQLLEIAAVLHQRRFPFTLTLIGDGPLRRNLESQRSRLGLTATVSFTGSLPHEEVDRAYQAADCFLFTGKIATNGDRAGFPNVLGEAMAAGVPVCATDVGAVAEAIRHRETGIVLDMSGDAAAEISTLLNDPETCQRIRTHAFKWVKQHFNARRNQQTLMQRLLLSTD